MHDDTISRRGFFKGTAAAAAALAGTAGMAVPAFADAASYIEGTYSSTQSTGFATVEVTATFSADAMVELAYEVTETSANDFFPNYTDETSALCDAIVEAQSTEVDGISGASLCTTAIVRGAESCIAQALGEEEAEEEAAEAPAEPEVNYEAWLGEEPATPESFAEQYDADVVVVGSGYAGIAATRMAVEEGATVVMLNKGEGLGLQSSAMAAIGSQTFAKRWPGDAKYYDLKGFLVAQTCKLCLDRNSFEVVSSWANENGDAVDWWLSAVPEDEVSWGTEDNGNSYDPEASYIVYSDCYPYADGFDPTAEEFPCVPGSIQFKPKGAWQNANLAKAQEVAGDGLTILSNTPAVKLLREEGGRVYAVVARRQDGEYVLVNASKGVVLATGDFMSSTSMVQRFLPDVWADGFDPKSSWYSAMDAQGNRCNTGDGHRMGVWAGARMQNYGATMTHLISVSSTIGTMPLLWLDGKGRRFMNEDAQGQQFAEQVRMRPGQYAYQIFDATYDEHMPEMPVGHGKNCGVDLAAVDGKVDGEKIFRADTLEELLAQLEIDAESAMESVEAYNEMCAAGEDTAFGKNAKYMTPVEQGPFYAILYGKGDDLVSVSGLESDGSCRVLDSSFDPIPGLYVAGNCQGSRFAGIYPETMKGMSVAMAMTMGRVAGRNAAQGL